MKLKKLIKIFLPLIALFIIVLSFFYKDDLLSAIAKKNDGLATPLIIGTSEFDFADGAIDQASFRLPYDIAYSSIDDAIVITDYYNHRIRKLDLKTMEVSTIAGFDEGEDRFGFPGGGYIDGAEEEAMFNYPRGLAIAENGAIIIADTGNHAIRQIYDGQVTTIAGGKKAGYADGIGDEASFFKPSGVVIDEDGIIYVSDTLNHVIRKIDHMGKVTTYAGNQSDKSILNEPVGLTIDHAGTLYVTDSHHQIKKILAGDHIELITGHYGEKDGDSNTWKGAYADGKLEEAVFNFPKGITWTENDTLLVADTFNHQIRQIDHATVSTVVGTGMAGSDVTPNLDITFDRPTSVLQISGTLYVVDQHNNRIVAIDRTNE